MYHQKNGEEAEKYKKFEMISKHAQNKLFLNDDLEKCVRLLINYFFFK